MTERKYFVFVKGIENGPVATFICRTRDITQIFLKFKILTVSFHFISMNFKMDDYSWDWDDTNDDEEGGGYDLSSDDSLVSDGCSDFRRDLSNHHYHNDAYDDSDDDESSLQSEQGDSYFDVCGEYWQTAGLDYVQRHSTNGDGWSHGFALYDECGRQIETRVSIEGSSNWFIQPDIDKVVKIADPKPNVIQHFKRKNWEEMNAFIRKSTKLTQLQLPGSRGTLSRKELLVLFGGDDLLGGDQTFNCPLNQLVLAYSPLQPNDFDAIVPFLKSKSMLNSLFLSATCFGNEAMGLLAEVLNHVRINELNLAENNITDEGVHSLLSATNAPFLVELNLQCNGIGRGGFHAISCFLRRTDIALQSLNLESNQKVEIEYAELLIESLARNTTMKRIYLDNLDDILGVVESIEELVMNLSSVDALCQSNHRVESFGWTVGAIIKEPIYPSAFEIQGALTINAIEGYSDNDKIRTKLRRFYFQGEFNIGPFFSLEPTLMPNVLELVTVATKSFDEKVSSTDLLWGCGQSCTTRFGRLDCVYRLIRNWNLPILFNISPPDVRRQQLELENAALKEKLQLSDTREAMLRSEVDQLRAELFELCLKCSYLPNKRSCLENC